MGHVHSIYDTDPHFSIDIVTRAITNQSQYKTTIMQNDHNSERFTFEMPRYIEGHDMSLCNKVEVHYINIGSSGSRMSGMYEVTDLQLSPADENIVVCSWLISSNATALVGPLTFVLRFACTTANKVDYAWHTSVHSGISVGTSINNSVAIAEQYADVLESWYLELLSAGTLGVNIVTEAKNKAIEDIKATALSAANNAADEVMPLVKSEIEIEKTNAIDAIDAKTANIIDEVLNKLPRVEEANF